MRAYFYICQGYLFCNPVHMIQKIIEFKIVSHPADAYGHRPIYCQIKSGNSSIDIGYDTIVNKRRHRFPWKIDFFREEFVYELDQKIQSLSEECHNLPTSSYIQNIDTKLPIIMIKAARKVYG